jgi:hypothetical protein
VFFSFLTAACEETLPQQTDRWIRPPEACVLRIALALWVLIELHPFVWQAGKMEGRSPAVFASLSQLSGRGSRDPLLIPLAAHISPRPLTP